MPPPAMQGRMTEATTIRTGFYPGTFDPVTSGHMDIIERAAGLVDRLVIGVAENRDKHPLLPLEERLLCLRTDIEPLNAGRAIPVTVVGFTGLVVHAARTHGAHAIIRGLRAVADFEYENQMFGMNQHMAPDIDALFLMAREGHQYISSRLVKEIARLDGDISGFVPPFTRRHILSRLRG
ncbi:pantetheine-phosphate adenylyltransferase [Komagataeibacter diospyri]|uniref:Phosphopantetheine adenylyltransferase n=2 Tax=Komagataeibacter diospyri TaxID=1932662 RepID=A0A4P5P6A8_9PROT|nr:pantetheine-phosphate adenylyltransferase [Komagataeibacter diospyri]GCE91538.1 pantetheine-phosphate adenylyltransferase [Komagataeibacter diospyri]